MILSMLIKSNSLSVDSHRLFLSIVGLSVLIVAGMSCAQEASQVDLFPPTGGMWLPSQIPELEGPLRALGLEIDAEQTLDGALAAAAEKEGVARFRLKRPSSFFVRSFQAASSFIPPVQRHHHAIEGPLEFPQMLIGPSELQTPIHVAALDIIEGPLQLHHGPRHSCGREDREPYARQRDQGQSGKKEEPDFSVQPWRHNAARHHGHDEDRRRQHQHDDPDASDRDNRW